MKRILFTKYAKVSVVKCREVATNAENP